MSAPTNLETIAALDLDRRILHELLHRAQAEGHPKVIARLLQRVAENAHAWGQAVGTKPVCMKRGRT